MGVVAGALVLTSLALKLRLKTRREVNTRAPLSVNVGALLGDQYEISKQPAIGQEETSKEPVIDQEESSKERSRYRRVDVNLGAKKCL